MINKTPQNSLPVFLDLQFFVRNNCWMVISGFVDFKGRRRRKRMEMKVSTVSVDTNGVKAGPIFNLVLLLFRSLVTWLWWCFILYYTVTSFIPSLPGNHILTPVVAEIPHGINVVML